MSGPQQDVPFLNPVIVPDMTHSVDILRVFQLRELVRKSLNDIIEYFNTYANPKKLTTADDYNCFDFMVKPAIQVSYG